MRRLGVIDATLVGVLVPLWLAAMALQVRQVMADGLWWVGVYVASPADGTPEPEIQGFWPGGAELESSVRRGDRLLSLDGTPLAGLGPIGFFATAHAIGRQAWARGGDVRRLPVSFLRDGVRGDSVLAIVPVRFPWRMLPLTAGLVVTGLLVLLNRPGTRLGRAVFLAATVTALHWTWFFGGSRAVTYLWTVVFVVTSTCMLPLVLRVLTSFPEEIAPEKPPRWPWIFAITGPVTLTAAMGTPFPHGVGLPAMYLVNLAAIACILAVVARNFRRSGARGRRQIKWQLYGMYVGLVPVFAADLVILAAPGWWWLHDLATVFEIAIPVCLFIGIVRFHLYDVDRLITSAAAYSILSAVLIVAAVTVVPSASAIAARSTGLDPSIGATTLSAAIAGVLVWSYRRLSPRLERRLFRERYALEERIGELLAQLSHANHVPGVLGLVGPRLAECFHATGAAVWQPRGTDFIRVANVPGDDGPAPRLPDDDALLRAAADATGPVDTLKLHRDARPSASDPAVVLPVRAGGGLAAIVALGPKASGDVYLPGELALMAAVARQASAELDRLELEGRTAEAPLLVPRKYELLSRLGQGGMGVVLAVRHREIGARFALKLLPTHLARVPGLLDRFRREAILMGTLRHPNVLRVYDVDSHDGVHYLVMEHLEGTDLAALLRTGALDLAGAFSVARQVAAALAYAHGLDPPVVHRDVTPSNILVERESGRVVVTDFGIAKILDGPEGTLTEAGAFVGTRRYAAPEQVRGDPDVDARVDVYSLGLVIAEMLTGTAPAQPVAAAATPVIPPTIPEPLARLLRRATAESRDGRQRDGGELLAELTGVAAELGVAIAPPADLLHAPEAVGGAHRSDSAAATAPTEAVTRRGRAP